MQTKEYEKNTTSMSDQNNKNKFLATYFGVIFLYSIIKWKINEKKEDASGKYSCIISIGQNIC